MPTTQVQVLPTPAFRREKSFDISLLLSRSRKDDHHKTSLLPNVFRKLSENKKSQSPLSSKPNKPIPQMTRSKTIINNPENLKARRASQTVSQVPENDFQKELLEATRRRSMLVPIKDEKLSQAPKETANKPRISQSPVTKKQAIANSNKVLESKVEIPPKMTKTQRTQIDIPVVQQSIKLEVKPATNADDLQLPQALPDGTPAEKPKTFYFGMDDQVPVIARPESSSVPATVDNIEIEAIDLFAKSLLKLQKQKRSDSSESAMSSDIEENNYGTNYDEEILEGISLQLRPTLPKKQFEIPRFSPAAAWRLLSSAIEAELECNPWKDAEKQDLFENSDRNPETSVRIRF